MKDNHVVGKFNVGIMLKCHGDLLITIILQTVRVTSHSMWRTSTLIDLWSLVYSLYLYIYRIDVCRFRDTRIQEVNDLWTDRTIFSFLCKSFQQLGSYTRFVGSRQTINKAISKHKIIFCGSTQLEFLESLCGNLTTQLIEIQSCANFGETIWLIEYE